MSRVDSFNSASGACDTPSKRRDSRRASWMAERERDDTAEALGQGMYSLHALIGQGSFGRIHLASWRPNDDEGLNGRQDADLRRGDNHLEQTTPAAEDSFEESSLSTVAARIKEAFRSRRLRDTLEASAKKFQRRQGGRFRDGPKPARTSGSEFSNRKQCDQVCIVREQDGWAQEAEKGAEEKAGVRRRALKSVCKRKVTEKGLLRHIQAEIAVLRRCSHPFILSLSPGGQFQTSGHLHLVLDYCPGGDLFSLLGREGRLPESQARVCTAQIALALRHLHDRHIAYRDLKPENVCIDERGRAILVDFSLSRVGLDRAPGGKAVTFCGSPAYAAPEMISREGHDTRVDLWSLGCVVYEMLLGDHPFRRPHERANRHAMFARIRRGRPSYPPDLSKWALSLLKGLLAVDPDDRLGFAPPPLSDASALPMVQPVQHEMLDANEQPTRTALAPSNREDSGEGAGQPGAVANADRGTEMNMGIDDAVSQTAGERTESSLSEAETKTCDECDIISPKTEQSRAGLSLLLEHGFFCGLPGWGGPGTNGAWEDTKMEELAVMVPSLRDTFDVQHFDSMFTRQPAELVLQGHPHKGGPTPSFEGFDWRPDTCIVSFQAEKHRNPSFLSSVASALWC